MNKFLPLALVAVLCAPVSAQSFLKARKESGKSLLRSAVTRSFEKSLQPSRALRTYDQGGDLTFTDTLTYDRFGNQTESVNRTYRHVTTYDEATGRVILDDYSQERLSPTSPWETLSYTRKTTLNNEGIRTSIEDRDYAKIELDNKGRVVLTDDGNPEENEIDKSTYIWEGDKLVSLTSDWKWKEGGAWEEEHITIENIEILYEVLPFNPYEIDFMDYVTDLEDSRIAYNASGTYSDGVTSSPLTITSTVSEDKKEITTKILIGDIQASFEKLTYTDDYGSYRYESLNNGGDKYIEIYTYNEHGDLVKNEYEDYEYEENKVYTNYTRYEWTYDGNKPISRKSYSKYNNEKESLQSTEQFTAWYDGESIHNLQDEAGEIWGATLYTLTGTPLRTLSAEEVNAPISLPGKGIYLLDIRTSKGNVVKKIMQ